MRIAILLFVASALALAESSASVEYVGGTVPGMASASGRLILTGDKYLVFKTKTGDLKINYDHVSVLEYGQQVNRRYIMAVAISPFFLLSKKRKHFLTLGYADAQGRQQAMVLRVDKDDVRAVLAGLEAKTGRKVIYQDFESRKGNKG